MAEKDQVNHPDHYNGHPKGIECIDVIEDMPFLAGQIVKYVWRCSWIVKGDVLTDLRKARWYLDRWIARVEASQ